MLVKVTELSPSCLTRLRGRNAYDRLCDYLAKSQEVSVDLDTADAPSTSFLDEMVCKLLRSGLLPRVTFVASSERVRRRLSEIAGVRELALKFKPEPNATPRPVPPAIPHFQAEYEPPRRRTGAQGQPPG
ncbi:MAG: STAS-like domain-containing protein [Deltaproteobacteria bacterium]|jgi:hypothetical protein|nr:STAS-like domain-containing protein [Deltaproteobacteria bacterium]